MRRRRYSGRPPEPPIDRRPSIRLNREAVAIRLLDSALSDDDRDFIRSSVVLKGSDWLRMALSDRLRELVPAVVKEEKALEQSMIGTHGV